MSSNKTNITHSLKNEHAPADGKHDEAAAYLESLVEGSKDNHEVHVGIDRQGWMASKLQSPKESKDAVSDGKMVAGGGILDKIKRKILPSEKELDNDFVKWKMGNNVAIRGSNEVFFEPMPIYVRVGMHLLFYGSKQTSLLRWGKVENLLRTMSEKEGATYDDESDPKAVQAFIQNFIRTYSIDTSILQEQDLTRYPTRNSFFYRKLKQGVRPIAEPSNTKLVSSAADCRLTVFDSTESAKRIWVKGRSFSIKELINDKGNDVNTMSESSSLAIFRLAPADYHRYNHPLGPVTVTAQSHAGCEFYTVNPDAVNEEFDVFTANTRDVTMMHWTPTAGELGYNVAFVSVGAMLVGSNRFTGAEKGKSYERGTEMGYFAYGGSTVIAVIPPEAKIKWDNDLWTNSQKGLETLVKVGERLGVSQA